MVKNRIFLIRHARTEENVKGIIQGSSIGGNVPEEDLILLNNWGDSLKDLLNKSGLIISSDQLRSIKTAEVLRKKFKLPLLSTHSLRQRGWGLNEGKNIKDIKKSTNPYSGHAGIDLPVDAESLLSVTNRTKKFVENLKENFLEKNPIIVGHNEIISYILNELLGQNLFFHDTLPTEGHVIGFDDLGRVCEIDLHIISPAYKYKNNFIVNIREDAKRFAKESSVGIRILKNRGYKISETSNSIQAVVIGDRQFTNNDLKLLPDLKVVARSGSGVDAVDLKALLKKNVTLVNTPVYDKSVSEFSLALILLYLKNIFSASLDIKKGNWNSHKFYWSSNVRPTVGIIGLGRIGKTVCRILKQLDILVIAWSKDKIKGRKFCEDKGIVFCEDLNILFKESDVISLHVALNKGTKKFIGIRELEIMGEGKKPFLINTSRAGIIDNRALLIALDSGCIKGVALDVWNDEGRIIKDENDEKLRSHPEVISTPHISGGGYLVELMSDCLTAYNIDWILRGVPNLASTAVYK